MNFSFRYATLANYSPRGRSQLSITSRNICYSLKNGDPEILESMAVRILQIQRDYNFYGELFSSSTLLVPIPGSAPLHPTWGGLWTPKLIAEMLSKHRLGGSVTPILKRVTAVPKSSSALPGGRPTVDMHLKSMSASTIVNFNADKILMIDDVLSKGRTMCAAYIHLRTVFPNTPIYGFAPIRTQSFKEDIEEFTDPSFGTITFNGTESFREP